MHRLDLRVEGIAAALREFPGLEIVESCNGSATVPLWVSFRFAEYRRIDAPWLELAEFVQSFLALRLASRVGNVAVVCVRPRPMRPPIADLSVRSDAAERVEVVLRELAKEFTVLQRNSASA